MYSELGAQRVEKRKQTLEQKIKSECEHNFYAVAMKIKSLKLMLKVMRIANGDDEDDDDADKDN